MRFISSSGRIIRDQIREETSASGKESPFRIDKASLATGWKLSYEVEGKTYQSQMAAVGGSIFLLVVLLIPLYIFLSVFLSRNLSAPIEELAFQDYTRGEDGTLYYKGTEIQKTAEAAE